MHLGMPWRPSGMLDSLLLALAAEGAHSVAFFYNCIWGLSLSPNPTSNAPSSHTYVPPAVCRPRPGCVSWKALSFLSNQPMCTVPFCF